MNIIKQLFEPEYVKKLFAEKILPLYPNCLAIEKIDIQGIKKNIWETTYHVVIKFTATLVTKEKDKLVAPIYCTAHSSEPRENVYQALNFLWQHSFARGNLSIPRPLFYSDYFRGTFYRGVEGENLYHFIREKNYPEIEAIIPKAAAWFAKLHRLSTKKAKNFNPENSRIATIFPGVEPALAEIKNRYPDKHEIYQKIYYQLITREEKFLNSARERWLVHGDAHPENIVKVSRNKLAVIDFTDICLADFARDLGSFLQQLEYMSNRKIGRPEYAEKIKNLFLTDYFKYNKIKLNEELKQRIDNYYRWTALRTAIFFLLKNHPEPGRSDELMANINNARALNS